MSKIKWSFLEPISNQSKISPVEKAGEVFKKKLVVSEVAKELNIDSTQARFLVKEYFQEESIVKCRRMAEKELGTEFSKIHASQEKIDRIKKAWELYNKLGTLEKVRKILKVSRERVRQLLMLGNYYGLFQYDRMIEKKMKRDEYVKSITKDEVFESLASNGIMGVCKDFLLNYKEACFLLKKYKLSEREIFVEKRKENILVEYEMIVKELGRHPSSTDLQQSGREDWRAFDTFVRRYLGGTVKFRKDNEIEYTHVKKLHFASQEKKIREFFANKLVFKRIDLQRFLGVSAGTTCKILNKLKDDREIKVIPGLSKKFYSYEFIGVK